MCPLPSLSRACGAICELWSLIHYTTGGNAQPGGATMTCSPDTSARQRHHVQAWCPCRRRVPARVVLQAAQAANQSLSYWGSAYALRAEAGDALLPACSLAAGRHGRPGEGGGKSLLGAHADATLQGRDAIGSLEFWVSEGGCGNEEGIKTALGTAASAARCGGLSRRPTHGGRQKGLRTPCLFRCLRATHSASNLS